MCPSTDVGSAGRVKRASSLPQEAGDLVISRNLVSVSLLSSLNQPPGLQVSTLYKPNLLQPEFQLPQKAFSTVLPCIHVFHTGLKPCDDLCFVIASKL